MAEEPRLREKVAEDVTQYVGMKVDAAKLSLVENMSHTTTEAIGIVILLLFLLLALMLFTTAAVYALYLWLGSVLYAVLIMGVLYVLIGAAFFCGRRMFTNRIVRLFSRMFFEN